MVLLGPVYIGLLRRLGFGKQIRAEGPEGHEIKAGTPTMGGMLIVLVVMFLAMAMRIEDAYTLSPMLALVGVGILGRHRRLRERADRHRHARALEARVADDRRGPRRVLHPAPLRRDRDDHPAHRRSSRSALSPSSLFAAFVIVGVSNAVNLTDGLDGLAGGILIFSFVAYLLIALVPVEGVPNGRPNLAVFCALIIGALMGFLWFNVHPAQLFMGDAGSLSMGATLAVVATITGQLPLLAVIGAVFFAVIMSVVLQVLSFRLLGRRIFRIAPLHHHFELLGWAEEKITLRFWIVAALAGLLGFSLFLYSVNGLA